MSDYQKHVAEINGVLKNGKLKATSKLIPHLFKHEKYVIHYRNLKYVLQLGVKVSKNA
jgi:hypothetical protein